MIEFISGPMKSGKSKMLLERIFDKENQKQTYMVIKPAFDTRDGHYVKSRATVLTHKAIMVNDENDEQVINLIFSLSLYDHLFIDEVQFFSTTFIKELLDSGINITASGLMFDYKGNVFPSSGLLLKHADTFHSLDGTCDHCGSIGRDDVLIDTDTNELITEGGSFLVEDKNNRYQYKTLCIDCLNEVEK